MTLSETISYFGLWKLARYGCFNIWEAVGRFLGFIDNIDTTSSIASW